MSHDDLKSTLNELLGTRFRAPIINRLALAAKEAGFEGDLHGYLMFEIKTEMALKQSKQNGQLPQFIKRDGLRKPPYSLTDGQISSATSMGKLKCQKEGRFNVYPTAQPFLQAILDRQNGGSLFSSIK